MQQKHLHTFVDTEINLSPLFSLKGSCFFFSLEHLITLSSSFPLVQSFESIINMSPILLTLSHTFHLSHAQCHIYHRPLPT